MNGTMLALILGADPELVDLVFASSTSWVVPSWVSRLEKVVGYGRRGTNGTAAYNDPDTTEYRIEKYSQLYVRNGDGSYSTQGGPTFELAGFWQSTPPNLPASYTDPADGAASGASSYKLYIYFRGTRTVPGAYHPATPPTTGASATISGSGVSLVFPGSTGSVVQTPTEFNNVAVTPGSTLTVSVPSGGTLTISYYK